MIPVAPWCKWVLPNRPSSKLFLATIDVWNVEWKVHSGQVWALEPSFVWNAVVCTGASFCVCVFVCVCLCVIWICNFQQRLSVSLTHTRWMNESNSHATISHSTNTTHQFSQSIHFICYLAFATPVQWLIPSIITVIWQWCPVKAHCCPSVDGWSAGRHINSGVPRWMLVIES